MTPTLVFLHGWGCDAAVFAPLRAALPGVASVVEDLGFFGPAKPAETTGATEAAGPLVLVGHSLGLALLLEREELLARASAVVALCAFPRFCRAPDFKAGLPPRLVQGMLAKFHVEHEVVLNDFLARCGLPPRSAPTDLDAPRLASFLERLLTIDVRDRLARLGKPLFALAAEDDLITPPALSMESFSPYGPVEVFLSPDGGHGLPLTRPAWCADRLRRCLAALADRGEPSRPAASSAQTAPAALDAPASPPAASAATTPAAPADLVAPITPITPAVPIAPAVPTVPTVPTASSSSAVPAASAALIAPRAKS